MKLYGILEPTNRGRSLKSGTSAVRMIVLALCFIVPLVVLGETIPVSGTLSAYFIELTLYDKVSGRFSEDNTAINNAYANNYIFESGNPPALGVTTYEDQPYQIMALPYEIKVTVAPMANYASATLIGVRENAWVTNSLTTVSGSTTNLAGSWAPTFQTGNYYSTNVWVSTNGTSADPILYAWDAPGPRQSIASFAHNPNVLSVTCHQVLQQYPIYQNTNGEYYPDGATNTTIIDQTVSYYTNSTGVPSTNCYDGTAPHWTPGSATTTSPSE